MSYCRLIKKPYQTCSMNQKEQFQSNYLFSESSYVCLFYPRVPTSAFREPLQWPCNIYKGRPIKSADSSADVTANARLYRELNVATNFPARKLPSLPIPRRRRQAFVSRSRAFPKVKVRIKVVSVAAVNPGSRGEHNRPTPLHVESLPVLISLRPPNSTNPSWHCMVTNTLRHVSRRTNHRRCPYYLSIRKIP